MKTHLFCILFLFTLCLQTTAQSSATNDCVTVWTDQGWLIKAKNNCAATVTFKFSWTTQGTNTNGEVTETNEESDRITLTASEERQLFTAPQDPNKKITYIYTNIKITFYEKKPLTKQELYEMKLKAGRNRG